MHDLWDRYLYSHFTYNIIGFKLQDMQCTISKSHKSSIWWVLDCTLKVCWFKPPQRQSFFNVSHFYPILKVVSQIPHNFFRKKSFQKFKLDVILHNISCSLKEILSFQCQRKSISKLGVLYKCYREQKCLGENMTATHKNIPWWWWEIAVFLKKDER